MDCLSPSSPIERTVFMKGAQIGGTECGNNWIGYVIHQAPGPMMAVQPTVEMAKRNSKQRIDPLIEESEVLRKLVSDPRSRDSGNTVLSKEFPGGVLVMTGANSAVGLRSMAARYLFLDEVDAYPGDVEGEGDPINLAMARTRTFARRKVFLVSTPKITGMSRIEAAYEESDKRQFFVPCPTCREFQVLKFPQLRWPKGEPEKAVYVCEHCGQEIAEPPEAVDAAARAVARDGQGRRQDGRLPPVEPVQSGRLVLVGRCRQAVRAGAEESVAPPGLREHRAGRDVDAAGRGAGLEEALRPARAVQDRRRCRAAGCSSRPARTCSGTASRSRSSRGAAARSPGRSITGSSKATPRAPQVWEKLTALLERDVSRPTSGVELPIIQMAVDSGYATTEVYAVGAAAGQPGAGDQGRLARSGAPRAPLPDRSRAPRREDQARRARSGRSTPAWPRRSCTAGCGSNGPPTRISNREIPFPPGYCHFPRYGEEYFKQLTAEQLVTKLVKGYRRLEWQKMRERNEALDCRVYARAAAARVGLDRFQEKHWRVVAERMGVPVAAAPAPAPQQPPSAAAAAPPGAAAPRPAGESDGLGCELWRTRLPTSRFKDSRTRIASPGEARRRSGRARGRVPRHR